VRRDPVNALPSRCISRASPSSAGGSRRLAANAARWEKLVKLRRYEGNPILSPNPAQPWEALVTTNPGACYDEARGQVVMLYRAAGQDPEHRISFGLATSADGYHFTRASDEPVFGPSHDGFDAGCVEDARVIKLGEWFFVTYAARPFPPGQYWLSQQGSPTYRPAALPDEAPYSLRSNNTVTGLALTRDSRPGSAPAD